ncbi:MAG TPA: hypothetical protein VF008_22715 [Niastella sp.]
MTLNPLTKKLYLSFLAIVALACFVCFLIIFLERGRLKNLHLGSFKYDPTNAHLIIEATLPSAEFYLGDSITTQKIKVIDNETKKELITFEIDLIPGKFRWHCNSFTKLRNYQNDKYYPYISVINEYFNKKLPNANNAQRKVQAILAIGVASQEGSLTEQESLSDKRSTVLYDALDKYLDSVNLNVPRIKVSFGQYLGNAKDGCDEHTDEQRIVAFIKVYDSNIQVNDETYASFQSMFYKVCDEAFQKGEISLNGLNYSRYKNQKAFLQRNFF